MCGIAGIIHRGKPGNIGGEITSMLRSLKHRGPDLENFINLDDDENWRRSGEDVSGIGSRKTRKVCNLQLERRNGIVCENAESTSWNDDFNCFILQEVH